MTPERLADDCQHKNRHWRVFCVECVAGQEAHIRDIEAQNESLRGISYRCERMCERAHEGGSCRCSELFQEVPGLTAQVSDLEAQLAVAREIINEIRSEAQRTIDWNQTRGMRPATDTSMFTGSYGAAVRVARMITAACATATQPSEVDGFGDLIGSTPSLPWPRWDATPPSPEVK